MCLLLDANCANPRPYLDSSLRGSFRTLPVASSPPRSRTSRRFRRERPPKNRKPSTSRPASRSSSSPSEPDIHKPLNLAFDDRGRLWVTEHGRISLPGPGGHPPARHGQDPRRLSAPTAGPSKIETFADGLNIPIGLLPLPSADAALVHNIPNIYLMQRHRRRRPGRHARGPLRDLRQPRHARHDQRLHLGLRRLDLRLPRLLQRLERRRASDHKPITHELGQHLPDEARRLARRVLHARPGQPVRPGVRPAGQPLLVRLPQPAGLPAPPRGAGTPASASPTTASGFGPEMVTTTTARPGSAASATTRPTSSPRRIAARSSSATS